jgi:hypothetical protein
MKYTRVIPRDLFNEAKLLKCIGRLCLLIHDNQVPVPMRFKHNGSAFNVVQSIDGDLMLTNVLIYIKDKEFDFKTHLNSKSNYSLYLYDEEAGIVDVFEDNGEFTSEFIEFCVTLSN